MDRSSHPQQIIGHWDRPVTSNRPSCWATTPGLGTNLATRLETMGRAAFRTGRQGGLGSRRNVVILKEYHEVTLGSKIFFPTLS